MKSLILVLGTCIFSIFTQAQIVFNASAPTNPTSMSDLWSLTIGLPSSAHKYYITMDLTDEKSNVLARQQSKTFTLSGTEMITSANDPLIKAVQTTYTSSDFVKKYNSNYQNFPLGRYTVTFKLIDILNTGEPVAESSYALDNSNDQNLIQITPSNGQILEDLLPNFNWKLIGSDVKNGCSFLLTVKEILYGQTANDAMINNQTFFTLTSTNESYLYGIADRQLDIGKSYVWTVNYICGGKIMLNSEFWTFTIKDNLNKPKVFIDPNTFYKVQEVEDGSNIVIKDNYLKIRFSNTYPDKDGLLSYTIVDEKGKVAFSDKEFPLKVTYGENRYIIGLCSSSGYYVKPGRYKMIITNESNKKFYLNFTIKPDNACDE